jgi:hypothetical protein
MSSGRARFQFPPATQPKLPLLWCTMSRISILAATIRLAFHTCVSSPTDQCRIIFSRCTVSCIPLAPFPHKQDLPPFSVSTEISYCVRRSRRADKQGRCRACFRHTNDKTPFCFYLGTSGLSSSTWLCKRSTPLPNPRQQNHHFLWTGSNDTCLHYLLSNFKPELSCTTV